MTGADQIGYLLNNVWDSVPGVAALMGVTQQTMMDWRELSMEEMRVRPKAVRLMRLHRVVKFARDYGIDADLMLNFLNENPAGNENGPSLLFTAVYEKGDLAAPLRMAIERWKEAK